mgnify:CR=1 FL=1
MFTLGEIEQSEHNLLGAISEDDFLEALDTAPPQAKKKFFKKMQMQSRVQTTATSSRSRAEFEKRIHLLPTEIQPAKNPSNPDLGLPQFRLLHPSQFWLVLKPQKSLE